MSFLLPTVLSAFAVAVISTWLVRKAACAWGVLDHPDGVRKLHRAPIPLLGGVGVFGAWIAGMAVGAFYGPESTPADASETPTAESRLAFAGGFGPSLFLAAGVLLLTGILDDVVNLRPRWKLLGQTVVAVILAAGGLLVKRLWLFGVTVDLGWTGFVFSVVWLVGFMNSLKMFAGPCGRASTLC